MNLTDQQLNDIEARAHAAFEGPWRNDQQQDDTPVVYAPRITDKGTEYAHVLFDADWGTDADAVFVAHARTDVPALVAEVRRLHAVLAAEESAHQFTLRQRNNRSNRLLHLRDLALAGDTEALLAAAKDTLAASVDDHTECGEIVEQLTGTCPCGHDDYHDPHEWADRPSIWCPGISDADDEGLSGPCDCGEGAVHYTTADCPAAQRAAAPAAEKCGKCRRPFDPADTRFDGHAQHKPTPYCRGCVDRCRDNEIADHRCVICA